MKLTHGYYHLIAILTVAIWGLTFIATKVGAVQMMKATLEAWVIPKAVFSVKK